MSCVQTTVAAKLNVGSGTETEHAKFNVSLATRTGHAHKQWSLQNSASAWALTQVMHTNNSHWKIQCQLGH